MHYYLSETFFSENSGVYICMIIYLLAHICLLHSLIRHETKVNVWEVGPLSHRKYVTYQKAVQNELENHIIHFDLLKQGREILSWT